MSEHTKALPYAAEQQPDAEDATPANACPACDTARSSGAAFCPACGNALGRPAASSSLPEPIRRDEAGSLPMTPAAPTGPQEDRPFLPLIGPCAPQPQKSTAECSSCGTTLPPEASFCHRCGLQVGKQRPRFLLTAKTAHKGSVEAELTDEELTIGKEHNCELVIPDDEFVSRRHARLFRSDEMVFLEDLGSSNGTFLRVRRPIVLDDGDEIVVGTHVLRLTVNHEPGDTSCRR